MAESTNFTSSLKNVSEQTNAQCPGLVAQNVVLGTVCFLGIMANSVLLVFSFKHRHGSLTPDKMLITNFAVVDLIACIISLPLHVRAINGSSELADNAVCLARFFTMFTCFAVNIMTLAIIAIDRYDAICLAPNRKITCRKTAYFLTFVWLFACCTAVPGGTGHILTAVRGGHVCSSPGRVIHTLALIGKSIMLDVVTLWIVPSLCIMFNRFYGIVKYVRTYSSYLRSVLGTSGVQKEVKLTKICVALIATYLSFWVMFAVMVFLRNRYSSLEVHCTYLWAYSLAYCSFAVVPIEYMILDKRFITSFRRKWVRNRSRKSRKVSPDRGRVGGVLIHLNLLRKASTTDKDLRSEPKETTR